MKTTRQQLEFLALATVSALALSACGGSSASSGSTTPTAAATAPRPATPPPPPRPAAPPPAPVASSGRTTPTATTTTTAVPGAITDGSGSVLTLSASGGIDHGNAFFQAFGNGRSCASCHQEGQGWTITPAGVTARFNATGGTDPIFALVDGANSPNQRVSTLAQKQTAYSMLLNKGVIRVGIGMPAVADFTLQSVEDPYGYASAQELSLFRRPLPATNLKFLSTVMWDSRETLTSETAPCILNSNPQQCFASITTDLMDQANSAVKGHAQFAAGLTAAQQQSIAGFEAALSTAQITDTAAGSLNTTGANGGPGALTNQNYYFGINDVVAGDYRTGAKFNPNVFTLYSAWSPAAPGAPSPAGLTATQAAIGRGELLFNTRPMTITNVGGFNDALGQTSVRGTCSSCHDTPNVGGASVPRLMNTGLAASVLRTPDLPLYTFKNTKTGATVQLSDPGLALQTGKFQDLGKFKVPGLRGLAARPPYFHNGSAPDLAAVVGFYNRRFNMGLNPQESADLVAFLQAL